MVLFKDSDQSPIRGGSLPYAKVIRGQFSSRRKVYVTPLQNFTPPPPPVELFPSFPDTHESISPLTQAPTQYLPNFDQERSRLHSELSDYRQNALQQVDAELAQRHAQFQVQLDADYASKMQAGYNEGLHRAQQETQAQLSSYASSFMTTFKDLKAQSATLEEAAKEDIIAISVHAAERMITSQLTLSPAIIRDIVDDAMRRITDKNKVIIRVNPHDSVWLKDHREWLDHYSQDVKEMIIQEDDKVEQGGCIIETKLGYIDSSIKSKVASIELALRAAYEEESHHLRPSAGPSVVVPAISTPSHLKIEELEEDLDDELEEDEEDEPDSEEDTKEDDDDFSFDGI